MIVSAFFDMTLHPNGIPEETMTPPDFFILHRSHKDLIQILEIKYHGKEYAEVEGLGEERDMKWKSDLIDSIKSKFPNVKILDAYEILPNVASSLN